MSVCGVSALNGIVCSIPGPARPTWLRDKNMLHHVGTRCSAFFCWSPNLLSGNMPLTHEEHAQKYCDFKPLDPSPVVVPSRKIC